MTRLDDASGLHATFPTHPHSAPEGGRATGPVAARYQTRELVGKGGMGEVSRAYDLVLQRDVAIKSAPSASPSFGRSSNDLLREARIVARLDHPNIVPVHDLLWRDEAQLPGLAMRMVRGEPFSRRLARQSLPTTWDADLRSLLLVVLQVCDAIGFAHEQGVLHLDLKPENIMVDPSGQAYVIDWGVAVLGRRGRDGILRASDAQAGLGGTYSHMAREQLAGSARGIDERTDVHGIGGLLYHVLSGCAPFPNVSSLRIARRVRTSAERVVAARLGGLDLPPQLAAIALKALSSQRSARHRTVAALRADIAQVIDDGQLVIPRPFPPGSVVVREGEDAREAYRIERGQCDVYRCIDGREVWLGSLQPGEVFGESALVPGGQRTATVIARTEVIVQPLSGEALQHQIGRGALGQALGALYSRFLLADAAHVSHLHKEQTSEPPCSTAPVCSRLKLGLAHP